MLSQLETFTLAPGFTAAGAACGLKESGAPDVALVASAQPCAAAGTFTTNRVKAAPVLYDQEVLGRDAASIRAVIANSGCANACTGPEGMRDARRMAALTAAGLGCEPDHVLVLSTGVIGRALDMEKLARGIAAVTSAPAPERAGEAARAILTTDTRAKVASDEATLRGRSVAIRGFAKGSGMIHPNLATMLAVVTTDVRATPGTLREALDRAVSQSFNRLSVDGDMSTNDTVLLLASGTSDAALDRDGLDAFTAALTEVCASLTRQIARDGEGATRLVEVTVTGADDEPQAHAVADAIARSALVRTAIHGGDPNWGRILAAAGASGAPIDPDRLALEVGARANRVRLVARGLPLPFDARAASELLLRDPVEIHLDLGLGSAAATVWTCDLSAEYVAINAHYTT